MSDAGQERIPFNKPALVGNEMEYVRAAVEGGHTSSSGMYSKAVAELLRVAHDASDVLLTTSCTDALEMAAMMLDLRPGDSVIVPSFTFVSTALAFTREGARILFADIEPETLGVDPLSVAELLDDSVRAVVPVHYAGVGCDMAGLREVLKARPDVEVVEDNAHGLFGTYQGQTLGTFGRFSTLSFHETKNFVCGEGGALVVNRTDDSARAHVLFDKGTNRQAFMLGQVDKYSWVDRGSSFGMSDMLAGFLLAQLEAKDHVLAERKRVFDTYMDLLAPVADGLGIRLPAVPADRTSAYHMFYILLPDRPTRDQALRGLAERDIQGTFHYVPLDSSDGGRRFAAKPSACPVTEDVSGRLLRLPFYNELSTRDIERVADALVDGLR
jgi:dTDP-4-amino-4,6-dideoxygalactose transaminase